MFRCLQMSSLGNVACGCINSLKSKKTARNSQSKHLEGTRKGKYVITRAMEKHEIDEIRNIDRSEIIEAIYYTRNGTLVKKPEFYDIWSWNEDELLRSLEKLRTLHDRGGTLLRCFRE